MKYKCHDYFMIRVPSLPIKVFEKIDKMEDFSFNSLFEDEQIKKFIEESTLIASEDLYHSLKNPSVSNKKRHNLDLSILKYLIRSSTRPTPYGLFAGVGLGEFSDCNHILIKDYYKDVKADAHWISHIIHQIEQQPEILRSLKIKFNPSCYVCGERIYNPYFTNHGEINPNSLDKIKENDIRYTNLVQLIKENTADFIPYSHIVQLIQKAYEGVPEELMERSLTELVENEYLYTNLRLPAYNGDALLYIIEVLRNISEAEFYVTSLTEIQNLLWQYKSAERREEHLLKTYNSMRKLYQTKNYCVINKGINFKTNYLKRDIKDRLEYFTETLSLIAVERQGHSRMTKFKESFAEEFGYGVEVSLLDIINPNGFDGLSLLTKNSIQDNERESRIKEIIDNKIQLALMNGKSEVHLWRKDFEKLQPLKEECYSSSFDINFYLSVNKEEQFTLTVAPNGGAMKAGGMFQRFADAFDCDLLEKYNTIYSEEKECTIEDYLLVEIREATCAGRHENIINQYKNYDYFLPIGCDEGSFTGCLGLKDISIGLSELGYIYIYSEKLKKKCKIITGNMLNTTLNSSLLQLLKCISDDNENHPMERLFALTGNRYIYTPRILLDQVVISVKKWKLTVDDLNVENISEFINSFRMLAKQYQIERYILMYENDNRLLLDCEKFWAIELLYATIKRKRLLQLSEIPKGIFDHQLVHGGKGDRYFTEYTFSFAKKYKESSLKSLEVHYDDHLQLLLQKQNRKLLPGSDGWLYFKLYGYESHQNIILTKEITKLIEELEIEKFFFLRYHDVKPHIRIRFQFKKEKLNLQLPIVFNWLKGLESKGLIDKAVIDTYERENNRYGGFELIDKAEQVFYADSLFVIRLLQLFDMENEDERTNVYMLGMLSIFLKFFNSIEELYELLDQLGSRHINRDIFHKKQKQYLSIFDLITVGKIQGLDKKFNCVINLYLNREKAIINYKNSLCDKLTSEKKRNIISSVVHMFCNRITGNRSFENYYRILLRHCVQSKISKSE